MAMQWGYTAINNGYVARDVTMDMLIHVDGVETLGSTAMGM